MKEQEAQEYMTALMAKSDGLKGAEAICLTEWQEATKHLEQAANSLNKGRAETKRLEGVVYTLQGKRMAYFDLLIAAEEGRRNAAKGLELVPGKVPEEDALDTVNSDLIKQPEPEEILGGRT